ncbi:phosphoethanolamine--lipid A transferase [Campylobacter lari]|uniref:Phosphoethanolamine--lipid A transferase n=1 Tax=Campylobacter lari TaxID=201 RepID=A0A6N6BER8_CAMLA|nr:phosphoethanolamine--lipid A transferase [Campylobacter lari]EAH7030363.1 phosphoethanolamine--lipid A transferase [Campylobacter lari]EAI4436393.1 phosphoethanolamine--lipid A transferase [Campylobacter lari]EAI7247557.1 phosphoethanolamine--lipid A transferase [Campylobacter lari]EAJ0338384.1 phosphoethanolamine--lipid A transferase [Campylobacter lari]EAK0798240.1 phosphoethanolamine--lipid A transferase [Campylobacter lari]
MHLKLSWTKFTLLNAVFIIVFNFPLFEFVYEKIDQNTMLFSVFFGIYFFLVLSILSLIYFPYITKILSIFLLSTCAICSYFISNYGVLIDDHMIQNVFETDNREFFSYFNLSFALYILAFVIFPSLLVIFTKIDYQKYFFKKSVLFLTSLVFCFALVALSSKTLLPFLRSHNIVRMYNLPFYPIYSSIEFTKKKLAGKKELTIISDDASLKDTNTTKLMILVIGETARASNYSLGAYKTNDTNFYTKNEPNLVYFSDVSSCGTATARSLPCMFSRHKRANFENELYEENVLDILQKIGVQSIWFGNNSGGCKGNCDRIKHKLIAKDYDESLLELVKQELENINSNKIIVVHLQGSHGPTYYKRYPNAFKKFMPTCDTNELNTCSHEQIINTYDNTLLYTDFIIKSLIDMLKQNPTKEASLLYLSDHGESLGENGIYLHGMPYLIAPKDQKHIPMIFWSKDSKLSQDLQSKKNYKLSQDNLFSSLLGYFGVNSKEYEANYDIFSKNLKENP